MIPGSVTEPRLEILDPVESSGLIAIRVSAPLSAFDPVAAFRRISPDGQGFILDGCSVEPGAGRYVYVGPGNCERLLTGPGTANGEIDPALALRDRLAKRRVSQEIDRTEAPFLSGAVGYFGYESIRYFEPSVGDLPPDPFSLPESAFFLPDRYVVFDRHEQVLTAVELVSAVSDTDERERAVIRAREMLDACSSQPPTLVNDAERTHAERRAPRRLSPIERYAEPDALARYEAAVRAAKREIERGELIQVVLSQRIARRTTASPLDIYEALAALNPSPYMFMLNFGDFALVGSSPELMVRSRGDAVSMHPIAGTRPRGETEDQDETLAGQLAANDKERAEHVMLVDLARNDLGRVSEPGSVDVRSFMEVERYSHVMHLVSRVTGRLRDGADGLDAFVAGFPLGTLTGAPRLRAVQMIAELEPEGRGPYCGGVGWFDASGDVDTGTIIRCIALTDGCAHVQGGGGIVFDSDPQREYLESLHKMAAQFEAISLAERKQATRSRLDQERIKIAF